MIKKFTYLLHAISSGTNKTVRAYQKAKFRVAVQWAYHQKQGGAYFHSSIKKYLHVARPLQGNCVYVITPVRKQVTQSNQDTGPVGL